MIFRQTYRWHPQGQGAKLIYVEILAQSTRVLSILLTHANGHVKKYSDEFLNLNQRAKPWEGIP